MLLKIIVFYLLSSLVVLQATEPFVWRQSLGSAAIVLPQKDGQTKSEAVAEYFKNINTNKATKALLEDDKIKVFIKNGELTYQKGLFESIAPTTSKPRFIVVTSELRELYAPPQGKIVLNVIKRLEEMGADVLVLPVLHDLNLNVPQGKEFRKKMIDLFDAQVILGGADIDPYLYGEPTTYARGLVRKRDVSELKFVRQFIQAEKGMNFGICRGHQMCAVANHKKLIQDIQIEEAAPEIHLNGNHPILIDNQNPVFSVFDKTKILVNSFHHQAVAVSQGDKEYKITALSLDSPAIIEAIEFRNGLGHTFQFHPELMHDLTGDKILRQFVKLTTKNKRLKGNNSCLNLFNALIAN